MKSMLAFSLLWFINRIVSPVFIINSKRTFEKTFHYLFAIIIVLFILRYQGKLYFREEKTFVYINIKCLSIYRSEYLSIPHKIRFIHQVQRLLITLTQYNIQITQIQANLGYSSVQGSSVWMSRSLIFTGNFNEQIYNVKRVKESLCKIELINAHINIININGLNDQ
ncbi:hypothetical protein FGO68_gene17709 [Halteria grandinella]|uniref:Uncharacterized protein n=1 Tax=Halteria grandinella TaxID=5974 RepID=A0A8J8T3F3_HALGN|nr:hypothetical protein FGO68_gene17709 [Halteria grandinella]